MAGFSFLVASHWEGAEIGDMARAQLGAQASSDPERIRLEGEAITLPPELATPFGLVLHELATNAGKYGALSNEKGRIILRWALKRGNDGRRLSVVWQEFGGPKVSPPEKRGFGGVLIERGLPGATVQRNFAPDGLVCTIEVDLMEPRHNGQGSGQ
jgi:two-component system CheB/CheR fusion protein